ncbi:MAG: T9SS type A sorting domain-containing protein [Lewinellaceae bacterium]|nr:T9SS type A sorting domain-containing protein [Lewinellaceae bacterium]
MLLRKLKVNVFGIVLVISLWGSLHGHAQCSGDLILFSQADVDNFETNYPSCPQFSGSITVLGAGITNLNGLSGLTKVGSLNFLFANGLTSLAGLNNLDTIVGALSLFNNGGLTSLGGLEDLDYIGGSLSILGNTSLSSLSGLSGLNTVVGTIGVNDNDLLSDLSGLGSLSTVLGGLTIRGNAGMTSLSGLNSLTTLAGTLSIDDCASLTSLAGLGGVTMINGSVAIQNNAALSSLSGLGGLSSISGGLVINNNGTLPNLQGLGSLTTLNGGLSVSNNGSLTSLTGLSSLNTILGGLNIASNPQLASLSVLSSLTSIQGPLGIQGNSGLTSLNGLQNIAAGSIADLVITNSGALSVCNLPNICAYLATPGNPATVDGNAGACATLATLQAACGILPVEWGAFTAQWSPKQEVVLDWQTLTETNNAYFVVEHSSTGLVFTEIGRVAGKGTSTSPHHYQFVQANPGPGIHYYRLRQVDWDGQESYSPLVSVFASQADNLAIYPNPTTDRVFLRGWELSETIHFQLLDGIGRTVRRGLVAHGELSLAGLSAGTYWLRVQTPNDWQVFPLEKK